MVEGQVVGTNYKTPDGRVNGTPDHCEFEQNVTVLRYKLANKMIPDFYKDKIVYDAACGWGPGTHAIALEGAKKVYGEDLNGEAIEIARKDFAHENVQYAVMDLMESDQCSDVYDIIVASEVVEHLTDTQLDKVLNDWYKMLKSDGYLFITTPERRGERHHYPMGSHWLEYEFDEMIEILKQHNFEVANFLRKEDTEAVSMALILTKVKE